MVNALVPQFTLRYDQYWAAKVTFGSWRGFQNRLGPYGSKASLEASSGEVELVFAPEGRDTAPLTDEERSAVAWVIQNEEAISRAVLQSVFDSYPQLQILYGYSGVQKAKLMPDITSTEDLRSLIGLSSVNIHQVKKNGVPYTGFEFGCIWDEERGLGVLMHGTRTVRVGEADTAFLLWIAEEDMKSSKI